MSSVLSAGIIFYDNPNVVAQNIVSPGEVAAGDAWFAADDIGEGAITDTQPQAAMPANSYTGWLQQATNSFLYGRLYIDPALLALGNLVNSQTRTVTVWNATFGSVDVTDLTGVGTEGLTLTEPEATPYAIGPLDEVIYTLAISSDGPATLDAVYTLTVDGVEYTFEVTAQRVLIWPFKPNWASAVNESLEWMTDVLKSYNGTEQRISLRTHPRRRLAYDFLIAGGDTQAFDNILWGWQNRSFAVPYWQYKGKTTAPIIEGDTVIAVNTTSSGYAEGQTMCLFLSVDVYEVLEILSFTDTTITLKNGTALDWPTNSECYPVGISVFESNIPISRQTSNVLTGSASFLADPLTTTPYLPVADATDVYLDTEIILKQPDWANPIDVGATYPIDTVDYSFGGRSYGVTDLTQTLNYLYRWIFKSRAEVETFRGFLNRCWGQQNAVFLPSWHDDFSVTADIPSAAVSISVVDRNFFTLVGQNPARANLYIRTRLGNFLRPIAAVGKTGNIVNIGIGTALGIDISLSDIIQVSYVSLYRLSTDLVTIEWQTDGVAIVEQAFQLVPQ